MSYVFFDLEWNQGYPRSEADKLDEIIQIGAVKLEDWQAEGEMFSAYVCPSIHRKLHHQVRKMLPLNQEELFQAGHFPEVVGSFFDWCGKDARFFTWGPSDAKVLDLNLAWYGMEEYLSLEPYDLQRAFDLMLMVDHQTSLKDAVEMLHLSEPLEFHDACNDAQYTAQVGAEMIRRFGSLPPVRELAERERELHRQRKAAAALEASAELDKIFHNAVPLMDRKCGTFSSEGDCLKSRNARVFRCPKCENWLCNGSWYQLGHSYVARSRCMEHGRFYTVLQQSRKGERWQGRCKVFTDEVLTASLFKMCKLGGEVITVCVLPRSKYSHRRKRTKTITVKPVEKANKESK